MGDNYYRLSPVYDLSKALNSANRGTSNGTNVHAWTYYPDGRAHQQWKIVVENAAQAYYSLAPRHTDEQGLARRLDVRFASSANGTNVWLYTSNASKAQRFILEKVSEPNTRATTNRTKQAESESPFASVRIYPNPSTDGTFIVEGAISEGPVQLYDLQGRLVPITHQKTGTQQVRIRTWEALPGLYILQIQRANGSLLRRKVVLN